MRFLNNIKYVIFVFVFIFSTGTFCMSIFDAGKACTFSRMELEITHEGKPVKNALVKRTVSWKKDKVDEFRTDEFGRVVLPEVLERSVTQLLPLEFVVAQGVNVYYEDKEYEIWINSKRRPERNSELGGKDLSLKCELTNEAKVYREFRTLLMTSCIW